MREAYESVYQVLHGTTVLLDTGDWLLEDPQIVPSRDVQISKFAGGTGARTWDRGNKMHTLSFSRWRMHDSTWEAAAARLAEIAAWPDSALDVTIAVQCHSGTLTLYKATITGLEVQCHERLTLARYTLEGGALTGALTFTGLPDDIVTEPAEAVLGTEDGDIIGDEDGGELGI